MTNFFLKIRQQFIKKRTLTFTYYKYAGFLMLIVCLNVYQLQAQTALSNLSTAELFQLAREKAFSGQRAEARELCLQILEEHPKRHEVRLLMGRTYTWDKLYEEGRAAFHWVLADQPGNKEAIKALFDLEMWSKHPETALAVIEEGLSYYPDDRPMRIKKAKVLIGLEQYRKAILLLRELLKEKEEVEVRVLLRKAKTKSFKNAASASYTYQRYSAIFAPMQSARFSFKQKTPLGTILLNANYANKFGQKDWQWEFDMYPKIGKGLYAYVNYGYSKSNLFPDHRLAIELFNNLPKGIEVSLGFRKLYFGGKDQQTTIYTFSLLKYLGNYMISGRMYLTPNEIGASKSFIIAVRKYHGSGKHFAELKAGTGFKIDDRVQANLGLLVEKPYFFRANSISLALHRTLDFRNTINMSVALVHQETSFQRGNYLWVGTLNLGYNIKF